MPGAGAVRPLHRRLCVERGRGGAAHVRCVGRDLARAGPRASPGRTRRSRRGGGAPARHPAGHHCGGRQGAGAGVAGGQPAQGRCRADGEPVRALPRHPDRLSSRPEGSRPSPGRRSAALIEAAADPTAPAGSSSPCGRPPAPGAVSSARPRPPSPALLHGLGNLLQNALEFARNEVRGRGLGRAPGEGYHSSDDGPGFPADVLDHLGEPYLSGGLQGRRTAGHHGARRVHIAGTLLARTGARLPFANRAHGGGEVRRLGRARLQATPLEGQRLMPIDSREVRNGRPSSGAEQWQRPEAADRRRRCRLPRPAGPRDGAARVCCLGRRERRGGIEAGVSCRLLRWSISASATAAASSW